MSLRKSLIIVFALLAASLISTTVYYYLLVVSEDIPPECVCHSKLSWRRYDFCYGRTGQRFSCDWVPIVENLSLLSVQPEELFDFDRDVLPETPVFVSSVSDNHFQEELQLIENFQRTFPPPFRLIVYDLGLSNQNVGKLLKFCQVEYRRFPFERYPEYVKYLFQYRWKPLLLAEILLEFRVVWYSDSSVRFRRNIVPEVNALFQCKKDRLLHNTSTTVKTTTKSDMATPCGKFPYLLHSKTGHSIFSATMPEVYGYIPSNVARLKTKWSEMYEAGLVFAARTKAVVQHVLKWYVLCALEEQCMNPVGASLYCRFQDRFVDFGGCHRFDQSTVNLLLATFNKFNSTSYTSGLEFFAVDRAQHLWQEVTVRECR